VVRAVITAGSVLVGAMAAVERQHGLSNAAAQTLAIIEGAGGPLAPSIIAGRLMVTTGSMTSLLDTLERRGLVQRQPHPSDRRQLLVHLTEEGQALVDTFLPEIVAVQTALAAGLSEADRAAAVRLTERLAEAATTINVMDAARRAKPRVKPPPADNPT
jgi:MarR family transcriptional regulator, 2-MHQ and catechol-resistance regulon repressor